MQMTNMHDYVQAYDNTWAMTSVNGRPHRMCYHRRTDGGTSMRPLNEDYWREYSLDELEMDPQPLTVHAINTVGTDTYNERRKIAYFMSRTLSRNWKRGLNMETLRVVSPDGWHPERDDPIISALLEGEDNFASIPEFWDELREARETYGNLSMAISPEIILEWKDGYLRNNQAVIHWNNHPVGKAFHKRRQTNAVLLGEFSYLSPKLEDYFGEVNVR